MWKENCDSESQIEQVMSYATSREVAEKRLGTTKQVSPMDRWTGH